MTEPAQPSTSEQDNAAQQPASGQDEASAQQPTSQGPMDHPAGTAKQAIMDSVLEIYEEPDAYAGLYNYAKALEDVEAGLLAGFFFKHYCLASNVIGSQSKGGLL